MASFPQFSQLPAEIQWEIWELAFSGPNAHFLTMNAGHHPLSQVRRIVDRYTDRRVTNLHQFGQSLVSLYPSPLNFTASWSRLPAIASSCHDANKTLVRLYKKNLRSGANSLFPLVDAQDILVISPIHAGVFDRPRVSYPTTPLSFETASSVGDWQHQFPLVVKDLPATSSLANIASAAIYWKPEMDDGVVCRQIDWLWTGGACPNLEKIYILDMDCPLSQQDFSAIKQNNRLVAGPWACSGGCLLAEVAGPVNIGAFAAGNTARAQLYQVFHSTVQNFVTLSARGTAQPIQVRNLTAFSPV